MRLMRPNRWALSLADLTLLMLAMMALVANYPDAAKKGAEMNAILLELGSDEVFVAGEAMLTSKGKSAFEKALGKHRAPNIVFAVSVSDSGSPTQRLDSWELAAARTAVIGRYIAAKGVPPKNIKLNTPDILSNPDQEGKIIIERITGHGTDVAGK